MQHDFIVDPLDLPAVPDHLLIPVNQLATSGLTEVPLKKLDGTIQDSSVYKIFQAPDSLVNWLKTIFDFEFEAEYIWMTGWSYKHRDLGRTVAYNYLLDAGGENIITEFYDNQFDNVATMSIVMPLHKWYRLNVSLPHMVLAREPNKLGTRCILSITPLQSKFDY